MAKNIGVAYQGILDQLNNTEIQ